MNKINQIKKGVDELKERLLMQEPAHFSSRDFVDAFFGALFLGITFSVKGLLIDVSMSLTQLNIAMIVLATLAILTAEIYFIGYSRVRKKSERRFGQFWFKRIIAFYFVAIITAIFLVYIFGLNNLPEMNGSVPNLVNLVVVISMPCAIGAAITDLIKKY